VILPMRTPVATRRDGFGLAARSRRTLLMMATLQMPGLRWWILDLGVSQATAAMEAHYSEPRPYGQLVCGSICDSWR
jgi:hypothetical protein